MELSKKNKINGIKKRGKAIVLAGLVLVGSAAHIKKVNASIQATGDPEIRFSDLMVEKEGKKLPLETYIAKPKTQLTDIRNREQVLARAQEVHKYLQDNGFTKEELPVIGEVENLKVEEIYNLIMLLNAQNPFDRPVEHEDIFYYANVLDVIMSKEITDYNRNIRNISAPEMVLDGKVIPYSHLLVDETFGKKIVEAIEYLRHVMINNPTKEGSYIAAMKLVELEYYLYLVNGYKSAPSYYAAETSGARFLGMTLAMNTNDMIAGIGKHVSYQNYTEIDGQKHYCDIDVQTINDKLNEQICPVDIITKDRKIQSVLMSPYSEVLTGIRNEANELGFGYSYTLK